MVKYKMLPVPVVPILLLDSEICDLPEWIYEGVKQKLKAGTEPMVRAVAEALQFPQPSLRLMQGNIDDSISGMTPYRIYSVVFKCSVPISSLRNDP